MNNNASYSDSCINCAIIINIYIYIYIVEPPLVELGAGDGRPSK